MLSWQQLTLVIKIKLSAANQIRQTSVKKTLKQLMTKSEFKTLDDSLFSVVEGFQQLRTQL